MSPTIFLPDKREHLVLGGTFSRSYVVRSTDGDLKTCSQRVRLSLSVF